MDSRKKILFVLNSFISGGAEKVVTTLLNHLDTSEFSLSLLYLRKLEGMLGNLNRDRLKSVLCYNGSNGIEIKLPFYIARYLKGEQIDTLVCVNQRPMLYSYLASIFTPQKIRIIQAMHKARLTSRFQSIKNSVLYKPIFRKCDAVIFVSEEQRRYWTSRGLVDARNSICIYNGVDIDHFNVHYSDEEKNDLRRRLGFSATNHVVGIFARLHRDKNHADLIEAIVKIRAGGIDAKLLIVGEGPEMPNLERLIKYRGLERDIVLTGFQEDVRPFMSICDCTTLVSKAESFPLCVIESMLMGKPVVASDSAGSHEQIVHGETGFLYKAGNLEELAQYLKMVSDKDFGSQMGKRAQQVAREKFDQKRMVREYARVLA
jgi:glycosyltransferase involved in cell wall biosynthesis